MIGIFMKTGPVELSIQMSDFLTLQKWTRYKLASETHYHFVSTITVCEQNYNL